MILNNSLSYFTGYFIVMNQTVVDQMMSGQIETHQHITVLLQEAIDALEVNPDGVYVDGTFGRGGHSRLLLEKLSPKGRLIAFDRDLRAIEAAKQISDSRFMIVHRPFSQLPATLESLGLVGQIDGMLFDLGVSSPQLDDPERGFSFMKKGPLDMRMDTTQGITAQEWIAKTDAETMQFVFKTFGEERFAKKIAHAIVDVRTETPFVTTLDLAQFIANQMPFKDRHKHPATRIFQAIRIAINSELEEIKQVLESSLTLLKQNGRLSVITFHSLEDRIVKQFIAQESKPKAYPKGLPLTESQIQAMNQVKLKSLGKQKPSTLEIEQNPRSRSAILRIAQRL